MPGHQQILHKCKLLPLGIVRYGRCRLHLYFPAVGFPLRIEGGIPISLHYFLKYTQTRWEQDILTEPCGMVLKQQISLQLLFSIPKQYALLLSLYCQATPSLPVLLRSRWSGVRGSSLEGEAQK